ncbi:MAG: hypothetical protein VB031_04660 [Eubacteriaceae bacterium]|nr:hypothetical protein [Eubacteriaceae bacterium]
MELQELLEMLELDEPEEFEYFENFADLIECDEDIPEETLYLLFSQTEPETIADIINSYFDELQEAVPDEGVDIYTLLESIKMALIGLMRSGDEDNAMVHFAEELAKFKNWYSFESAVTCRNLSTDEEKVLSLRDALTLARLEKMNDEEYSYDFTDCLDYELEDYIMGFADMAQNENVGEENEDIMSSGYVYDDEMKKQ